ncbi:hypothetical protein AZ602_05465 [Moraxella sp. RCAD0137]|nr:hypothetical protein AZ602_05465 [Moraxella sp. RCAD0137]
MPIFTSKITKKSLLPNTQKPLSLRHHISMIGMAFLVLDFNSLNAQPLNHTHHDHHQVIHHFDKKIIARISDNGVK